MADALKLDGGLNDLLINHCEGYLAVTIESRIAFKGDTTSVHMLAMLDRDQQRKLYLFLGRQFIDAAVEPRNRGD